MFPLLLKLGPIELSSFGVLLSMAFIISSFVIWRQCRDRGLPDEKVLDHILVTMIASLVGSRLFFVLAHWNLFKINILRIFLVWTYPGLSAIGALIVGGVVFLVFSNQQKLPKDILLDAYGVAMPYLLLFLSLATFLDGMVVGKETKWFTGLPSVGETGKRHPVGLYGVALAFIFLVIVWFIKKQVRMKKLPLAVLGWSALSLTGFILLLLAFFRADLLYLRGVAVDYIVYTVLFLGPMGPLFVLVDGRKQILELVRKVQDKLKNITQKSNVKSQN